MRTLVYLLQSKIKIQNQKLRENMLHMFSQRFGYKGHVTAY
jgi:hypothetical protein